LIYNENINFGEPQFENERENKMSIACLSNDCLVSMKKTLPKSVGETTRIHPNTDIAERDK